MGGASRQSATAYSKPKHRRPDQNGDYRDVSPANDADLEDFKHQIDGSEEKTPTPADCAALHEMLTPVIRKLDEASTAGENYDPTPRTTEHAPTFITRPRSKGGDVNAINFCFAPHNLKNPGTLCANGDYSGHLDFTKAHSNNVTQNEPRMHQESPQAQPMRSNRQPLGRSLPHHMDEASPPSFQLDAPAVSVEQGEVVDEQERYNSEYQRQGASGRPQTSIVVEYAKTNRASSIQVLGQTNRDPRPKHSESVQATETGTGDATLVSVAEHDSRSGDEDQEQPVSEISQDDIEDRKLTVIPVAHRSVTPATVATIEKETPSTKSARKAISASTLLVPSQGIPPRVTKPAMKQARVVVRNSDKREQGELSSEYLLEILISRSMQQKAQADRDRATADKLKTRIRTLNHSFAQLHREKEDIERSLDKAQDTIRQASADRESLRGQLETSFSRYRKLKDFARSMATDMRALNEQAEEQKASVSGLKADLAVGRKEAYAAVSHTQALLNRHAKEICSVRQETNAVFGTLSMTQIQCHEQSSRLKDEVAKTRRLETHIAGLQTVQQWHNKATKESNEEIQDSLSRIVELFASLEAVIRTEPQVPAFLPECLNLLQRMEKRDQVSSTDIGNLTGVVEALDTTVTKSVEKLDQTLRIFHFPENGKMKTILEDLKKTIAFTAEKEQELTDAEIERSRLEQKTESNKDLIEELRRAKAISDAHAESFQKGTEMLLEWSKGEQQKSSLHRTGTNDQLEHLRLRWLSASSDLKASQQLREDLQSERDRLLASAEDLQRRLNESNANIKTLREEARADKEKSEESHKSVESHLNVQINEHVQTISNLEKSLHDKNADVKTLRREMDSMKIGQGEASERCQKHLNDNEEHRQRAQRQGAELEQTKMQLKSYHDVSQQLQKSQEQFASARIQVEQLERDKVYLNGFQQKVKTLQDVLDNKGREVTSLRTQLQSANKIAEQITILQNQLNTTSERETMLQKSLDANKDKAEEIPALHLQLETSKIKIANLTEKLNAANEKERQFEETLKENASLNKTMQKTQTDLDITKQKLGDQTKLQQSLQEEESHNLALRKIVEDIKQQLDDYDKLKQSLRQKEAIIVTLQAKTAAFEQMRTTVETMEKACEDKDSNIRQLNKELARRKDESQQLGEVSSHLSKRFPDAKQALLQDMIPTQSLGGSQEHRDSQPAGVASQLTPNTAVELSKDVEFSQPLSQALQHRSGAILNVAKPKQIPRRVADRSGPLKAPSKSIPRRHSGVSQPQSSGSTSIVPNSQVEISDETLDCANLGGSSSPLSDLESEYLWSDDNGPERKNIEKGAVDHQAGRFRPCENAQFLLQPATSPERPSTAQTDLFNFHASGVRGPTAHRPGSRKKEIATSLPDIDLADDHVKIAWSQTVAPRDLQLNAGDMMRQPQLSLISPRRLRDGTQLGSPIQYSDGRPSTPMPETRAHDDSILNATPAQRRDKPQPNSAAKRSLECEGEVSHGSGSDKRPKRNLSNLEISRRVPKPTPATPARSNTSSGSRKGGSIIGTNAPAPNGAKKVGKGGRRSNKREKYAEKFETTQREG